MIPTQDPQILTKHKWNAIQELEWDAIEEVIKYKFVFRLKLISMNNNATESVLLMKCA